MKKWEEKETRDQRNKSSMKINKSEDSKIDSEKRS